MIEENRPVDMSSQNVTLVVAFHWVVFGGSVRSLVRSFVRLHLHGVCVHGTNECTHRVVDASNASCSNRQAASEWVRSMMLRFGSYGATRSVLLSGMPSPCRSTT